MIRLTLITLVIGLFSSCSLIKISEERVESNEILIMDISEQLISLNIDTVWTKNAPTQKLKKALKKMNIQVCLVNPKQGYYLSDIIILRRTSGVLKVEEIIVDIGSEKREIKGYKKIHDKVWFKEYVPIS